MQNELQNAKGLLSISIAFSAAISATEQLLKEVKVMHIWTAFAIINLVAHNLWAYSYFG